MRDLKVRSDEVVKTYKGYLILNWKNGTMKIGKRQPRPNAAEIVFEITFNVNVPDLSVPTKLQYNIKVPEVKVKDVMLDSL